MPKIVINRENSIAMLVQAAENAQKMGALHLRETPILKKALDYFKAEEDDKPDFDGAENPELVALNILLQIINRAQRHGGELAYSVDDAALLWEITEFWIKETGKEVTKGTTASKEKSSKSKAAKDDDSDDEDDIRPMSIGKGKSKA